MTMHILPLHRRVVAFVFPLIILVIVGVTTPTFIEVGLPWWPLFIFGLPAILSVFMAIEYWNVAIGFDADGVRYRSGGYSVSAPWSTVSERASGRGSVLYVDQCEPRYRWWLGGMQVVLGVLWPARSRYAHGLMAIIPVWWFSTGPNDPVMADFARFSTGKLRRD